MELGINFLAILLAAIASTIIGFIWYGWIFAKQWMALYNHTPESLKAEQAKAGKFYAISFVLTLLMAYILAHVAGLSNNFFEYGQMQTAITSALFMWFGFVMPIQVTGEMFGEHKWKRLWINVSYQLVSLIAMGLIIGSM